MEIGNHSKTVMDVSPYLFERAGDVFRPTSHTLGPWGDVMHGAAIEATLVQALDSAIGTGGFRLARSSVELFRPAPLGDVRIAHTVIREGSRVRVADASMMINDVLVARCLGLFLKESSPEGINVPDLALGPAPMGHDALAKPIRPASEPPRFIDVAEIRPITFGEREKLACAWVNIPFLLTSHEPLSPAARAAAAADYLSGISFMVPEGLRFINSEVTMHLNRPPSSQWICVAVDLRVSYEGTGLARATLSDDLGIFGSCAVSTLATEMVAAVPVSKRSP